MKIREIRGLSPDLLQKELDEERRALLNLRFRLTTLQLKDVTEISKTRRSIARIETVMREREIAGKQAQQ
ncbi:MAG: 50S ribosomal protein L29 [SAR202 cluster bacterium]|nr:50S ribosomal protein L29 [SAR202 cluster bacterium]